MVLSCDELTCTNDYLSVRIRSTQRQPDTHNLDYFTLDCNTATNYPRPQSIFNTLTISVPLFTHSRTSAHQSNQLQQTTAVSFQTCQICFTNSLELKQSSSLNANAQVTSNNQLQQVNQYHFKTFLKNCFTHHRSHERWRRRTKA